MKHPDVIVRSERCSAHLPDHPLIRQRLRPGRIHLDRRYAAPRIGSLASDGDASHAGHKSQAYRGQTAI